MCARGEGCEAGGAGDACAASPLPASAGGEGQGEGALGAVVAALVPARLTPILSPQLRCASEREGGSGAGHRTARGHPPTGRTACRNASNGSVFSTCPRRTHPRRAVVTE